MTIGFSRPDATSASGKKLVHHRLWFDLLAKQKFKIVGKSVESTEPNESLKATKLTSKTY
jgi:hypothetical protein